ncbi:hypothetical protein LSH36_204g00003 [Paralvinella palmiformis]|uniref:G-protein coupled receptors family 1 profile domain-containing protein n=1 Tax=Paralvinella palmiformis TaxID=53620 RepID=A0AAD9JQL4_9ANNE|nr:hypothetical protein LSH36_204g00003 [Paralvinella palmiformis]
MDENSSDSFTVRTTHFSQSPFSDSLNNETRAMQYPFPGYQLVWTPEVVFRVTTIIVVMFFTLVGNSSLIVGIVCHQKLRRKRVNIFLVNLAVGDLMVCLVTMTTEILFVAFGEWVLGAAACKIIVYGQIVTLASATFLLTAMSIDRYQVIVQPFKSLTGQPKIWRKVLTAWGLAFVFAIPQLFIFVQTDEGVHPDGHVQHMCKSKGYTAQWQRKLYFTLMTVYILIVPTLIMSFCYINIIKVVWMRTTSQETRPPKLRFVSTLRAREARDHVFGASRCATRTGSMEGNTLNIPPRLVSNSKRNVVKMTLSVIIGFVLCWTPYFVVSLVRIYSDYRIRLTQALSVTEIMALIHSALNPILYGIFNTHMARRACKQLCARCCTRDIIVVRELNVSEDDSTYWTETKIQNLSMVRLSIAQPVISCHHHQLVIDSKREAFCRKIKSCLCCSNPNSISHSNPLLVYRRAASEGHVALDGGHYESFRLRAHSVGSHEHNRLRPNYNEDGFHRYHHRSSVSLEVPLGTLTNSNSRVSNHVDYEFQDVGCDAPSTDVNTAAPTDPCITNIADDDSESRFSLDSAVRTEVAEYLANL